MASHRVCPGGYAIAASSAVCGLTPFTPNAVLRTEVQLRRSRTMCGWTRASSGRGPKEERLVIAGDPKTALDKLLKTP
jgi:hypothetical protein